VARGIYERLGGGSPLLANTLAQARALEAALGCDHRCFVAMRYWHPLSEETARDVAEWEPRRSSASRFTRKFSTTASSLAAWRAAANRDPAGFAARIDLLVESTIEYLAAQVEAGAEVLQLFDTWAGSYAFED
jgi:protoheme ferro-lyase